MALLFRRLDGARWRGLVRPKGKLDAWVLKDLEARNNSLSFFIVDSARCPVADLVASQVAGAKNMQAIYFALVDDQRFIEAGFALAPSVGMTKCKVANEYHVDIENLTTEDLVVIANILDQSRPSHKAIAKPTVIKYLQESVNKGNIDKSELDPNLAKYIPF